MNFRKWVLIWCLAFVVGGLISLVGCAQGEASEPQAPKRMQLIEFGYPISIYEDLQTGTICYETGYGLGCVPKGAK